MLRKIGIAIAAAGLVLLAACGSDGRDGATGPAGPAGPTGLAGPTTAPDVAATYATATPIKHIVIIYGENISFDHYFATYPTAMNLTGETAFTAKSTAPANGVNNLSTPLDPTRAFAAV